MSKQELTLVERARQVLAPVVSDKALQELAGKYADFQEVKSKTDLDMAMGALRELRATRTSIEKAGKDARADARAFADAVIAEERRLVGIIKPEEERIQTIRKAYEEEQARIKREEEERERARINGHKEKLRQIIELPARMAGKKSGAMEQVMEFLKDLEPGEDWEEFAAEAHVERDRALVRLGEMLKEAMQAEKAEAERQRQAAEEAERRRQEAEELAKQRAEQERQAAELRRQQEEIERQRQEIERQKRAAEEAERQRQAAILEEQRRKEADDLERQQAEERRQAEEQARQQAEADAKARKQAEAKARKTAEPEAIQAIRAWAKQHRVKPTALDELLAIVRQYLPQAEDQAA